LIFIITLLSAIISKKSSSKKFENKVSFRKMRKTLN